MKNLFLAVLLSISLLVPACAWFHQPTVQQQAVKTLYSVHKTVDAALDAYLDLVIAGKLPTNSVPRVTAAYGEFQTAYNANLVFVSMNTNSAAPTLVLDSAAKTIEVIKKAGDK